MVVETNHSRGLIGALRAEAVEEIRGRVACLRLSAVRERIDYGRKRGRLGKECGSIRRAWSESLKSLIQALTERFERRKEKSLVLHDGPACVCTELIQPERLLLKGEGVARVENVISEKFKKISMISIRAAR